jgi:hypothetical protein
MIVIILDNFKVTGDFRGRSWSCDQGAMDGFTDKTFRIHSGQSPSLYDRNRIRIRGGVRYNTGVSIERGARELAL